MCMLMCTMALNKRMHVPVSEREAALFKAAARKARLTLAEWARQLLRQEAGRALGREAATAEEALDDLFGVGAPVGDVQAMIDESTKDRYR